MEENFTPIKDERTANFHLLLMVLAKQQVIENELAKINSHNTGYTIEEVRQRMNVLFSQKYRANLAALYAEYGFLDFDSLQNPME